MEYEAEVTGIGVSVDEDGMGAPVVVLEANDAVVPIFVTPDQAQSMHVGSRSEPPDRPLTHDLLLEMITEFGGAIDRVRIDEVAEGTFYGKVDAERYEEGERDRYVFDARPSDAIAIALRVDCTIEISESVLEDAGRDPDQFELEGTTGSVIGDDVFEGDDPEW